MFLFNTIILQNMLECIGMPKVVKRVLIDIAGFGLLLLVPFLGPIPGPGGIAIFLAALGLLSINHEWARRWREHLQTHGNKAAAKIFPENRIVQLIYDVLVVVSLGVASILLIRHRTSSYVIGGISLASASLLIFAINRNRWSKLTKRLKRK